MVPMRTRLLRYPTGLARQAGPVVAALGSFDGLHLGHQELIRRLHDWGQGQETSVLISFYPHPSKVLRGLSVPSAMTTLRQRREILSRLRVDCFYLVHFTKALSRLSAEDFLETYIIRTLGVDHLVLGPDARVGFERKGTPEFILDFMQRRGRSAEVVPFLEAEGERISSRRIRDEILAGRVSEAATLLGRRYVLDTHVVRGDQRGRQLGFPTANLRLHDQVVPGNGVYATESLVRERRYPSVTNIGVRPTFNGTNITVETHLLDYKEGEFYQDRIQVEFVKKIRDEQKFSSLDLLKSQIEKDIASARDILSERGQS